MVGMQGVGRHLLWMLVKDVVKQVDADCDGSGAPARAMYRGHTLLEFDRDETMKQ